MKQSFKPSPLINRFILLLLFAVSHFFLACSEKQDEYKSSKPRVSAEAIPPPHEAAKTGIAEELGQAVFSEEGDAGLGSGGNSGASSINNAKTAANGEAPAEKLKLIKTCNIAIEVDSVEASIAKTKEMIGRYSGYVSESNVSKETNYGEKPHTRGTLTLQIPADKFDEAISSIKTLGTLKEECVSTEDVTKAYFDLETRLHVKRNAEERLTTLLKTRTGSVSQVLEVERELERLTLEIEDLLGNKRYYDKKIAFSTIHCELRTPGNEYEKPGPFAEIGNAFTDFFTILSESLGGLIRATAAVIPWLPVVFIIWKGIVFLRRRQKEKKQAKQNG